MQIYETLKERGLTTSWRDYSVRFLRRAPNYLSATRGSFTLDTCHNLFESLAAAGQYDLAEKVIEIVFGNGTTVNTEAK